MGGHWAGGQGRPGLSAADLMARSEGRPMSTAGTRLMAGVGPPRVWP
jgi:hypothetical protein